MASAPPDPSEEPLLAGPRRWVRRHERNLIAAWLVLAVLTLAVLAVWGLALGGAERLVEGRQERWVGRLDEARALLDSAGAERALPRFVELVDESPAVFVKHRLDRQHERALKGLAECYTQLDKKRRALETLERLVAFDPRNYANHFELARALERFEEPDAAREAYRETLRIHPTHLPAVEALIGLHADGGRQAEVVATYEAYLDAYLLARLELTLGAARATVEVPADGRVHRVEVALPLVGPEAGWPCLATHGYSLEPLSLRLEAPQRVGTVGSAEPTLWTSGSSGLETSGFELRLTVLAAVEPDSTACLVLELPETGVTRAVLELRVFKMLPAELWNAVQAAYRNTLAGEALERARERSAVGGLLSAGSVWGG